MPELVVSRRRTLHIETSATCLDNHFIIHIDAVSAYLKTCSEEERFRLPYPQVTHSITSAMQTAIERQTKDPVNWATNYVEFLSNFTCRAPLFPNDKSKLVTITDHNTVGEAFKKMIDNHITSIPVLHHATKNPLYVISLMHFAQYLVSTYKKSDFVDSFWNYLLSIFKDNSSQFLRTTIDELQQNTFYTLDPAFVLEDQETLLKAVELMVRSQTHRVLVVNNIGDVVNVITQSRILELLGSIIDCLPNNTKTIEELGLAKKVVATIHETESAYDAFKVMTSIMVMGLPVVDDNGTLIGSISVSDLKVLGTDEKHWNLISKPVRDFLKYVKSARLRSGPLKQLNEDSHVPVVRCHPWHSLGFVIRHVVFFKIHRIYIVNELMKPIGVVTLTDILKSLLMDDYVQMEIAEKRKA